MCLILFAYETHPEYSLILAANRDEYHDRPTAPAEFWNDAPQLLAGRDLTHGGTWLGITRSGRIAAITNYRDPGRHRHDALSRGDLTTRYLQSDISIEDYLRFLEREGEAFNDFNLIFGSIDHLCCLSNRADLPPDISPGVHTLSNHLLDTQWPKSVRGRQALTGLIASGDTINPDELLLILSDRTPASDDLLPDTGIGMELERLLSPMFITSPRYGTRSSTVILVGRDGNVTYGERTYVPDSRAAETAWFTFKIEKS
jgi:uncharacterized protein with NRDE domain